MGRIRINIDSVVGISNQATNAKNIVKQVRSSIITTRNSVDSKILNRNNLSRRFNSINSRLSTLESKIIRIQGVVSNAANNYYTTDNTVNAWGKEFYNSNIVSNSSVYNALASAPAIEKKEKESLFGWEDFWEFTSEAGIAGSFIAFIGQGVTGGHSFGNGLNVLKNLFSLSDDAISFPSDFDKNHPFKSIFGLQDEYLLDYSDVSIIKSNKIIPDLKNIVKNSQELMDNNFFNQYVNDYYEEFNFNNYTSTTSKIQCGAKWAGAALSLGINAYENFTDYEENNSTGRKIAETIGETVVDAGMDLAVGAGITFGLAALGMVNAPVLAVGAATVAVTWGIDALSKTITGKDVSELVSDFVLDSTKGIVNGVGAAINKGSKWISTKWKSAFAW